MRKRISADHGHRVSQEIRVYSLLSHIDYSKPTEVKASGRSGPATLDSRSLRSSSKWHSSAGDEHAWKYKSYDSSEWDGSKWSAPTSRNLSGSGYDADRDWQARTMRKDGHVTLPAAITRERSQPTQTQRMI